MAKPTQNFFSFVTAGTFKKTARILIPTRADWPDVASEKYLAIADDILTQKEKIIQKKLKLFLWFIEISTFFYYLRPFSWLPPKAQKKHLARLASAPLALIRQGFWGIKNIVLMAYFTDEAVWPQLKYNGPVIKR